MVTFSKEDQAAISEAVRQAEKKTAAEIVPVVAATSDRYERAEDLVGLAAALVAVSAVWALLQAPLDWDGEVGPLVQLPIVLGAVLGGWILGVLLAKGVPALKRLAASRKTMTACVLVAAHHAFDALHADRTKKGTGVVIYVSVFERRVCVWADRRISAAIAETEWKTIAENLSRAFAESKPREGLIQAIQRTGDLLASHVPIKPGDTNEISNELRILE